LLFKRQEGDRHVGREVGELVNHISCEDVVHGSKHTNSTLQLFKGVCMSKAAPEHRSSITKGRYSLQKCRRNGHLTPGGAEVETE
jgi:hypothetical protein